MAKVHFADTLTLTTDYQAVLDNVSYGTGTLADYVQRIIHIIISNDSANTITYSWDGSTDEVNISAGEVLEFTSEMIENARTTTTLIKDIYLKGSAGGESVRVWIEFIAK